jgi:hypothetical protein
MSESSLKNQWYDKDIAKVFDHDERDITGEVIEAINIYKQIIKTISNELDNPPMYFSALDYETREEIDVYPLREVRDFMDRLKMALLVSAKKEGEKP